MLRANLRQVWTQLRAADKPSAIAKNRLASLLIDLGRSAEDVCRIVGRSETEAADGALVDLSHSLHDAIASWRALNE